MSVLDLSGLSFGIAVSLFLAARAVIGAFGAPMTRAADRLADVRGWGEAIFGAVLFAYAFGIRRGAGARGDHPWAARQMEETRPDQPDVESRRVRPAVLWLRFADAGVIVGVAGYVVGQQEIVIADRTGLAQTIVGRLFTAVSTSLPELVTAVAAARRGALTLAVGGVIDGNSFDVLFVASANVAYRPGSIYYAMTGDEVFIIAAGRTQRKDVSGLTRHRVRNPSRRYWTVERLIRSFLAPQSYSTRLRAEVEEIGNSCQVGAQHEQQGVRPVPV